MVSDMVDENDERLSRLTTDELKLLERLIAKMDGLTDEEIALPFRVEFVRPPVMETEQNG